MEGGRGRLGKDNRRIGTGAGEITAHLRLKVAHCRGIDVQLPIQVSTHLKFLPVNLPQGEHTLANVSSQIILNAIMNAEIKRR